jgi:hypothetical protein
MSGGGLTAAVAAVERYASSPQDVEERADGYEHLQFVVQTADARRAITGAEAVRAAGGEVEVRLTLDTDSTLIRLGEDGIWDPEEGDPSKVFAHLDAVGPKNEWSTVELVGSEEHPADLTTVRVASVDVSFDKAPWRKRVAEQTGRSIWIGRSVEALARWLCDTTPDRIAAVLFDQPGALVLLERWTEPAIGADTSFTLGGLAARPSGPPQPRARLQETLRQRRETADLAGWRMVRTDTDDLPSVAREPLHQAMGLMAARLIAETRTDAVLRPSATHERTWMPAATPGETRGDYAAMRAVGRWVSVDLGETRFAVAREVCADRIEDPAAIGVDAAPIEEALKLAYTLVVRKNVRESLDRQKDLERTFLDLDEDVRRQRSELNDALDGALTKAIGGALAVTIAALTSAKVRGWPATYASLVLAAYLMIAMFSVRGIREDALERLEQTERLVSGRLGGLGDQVSAAVGDWKKGLRGRARSVIVLLVVFAIGAVAVGVLQNAHLMGHHKHKAEQTTQTTP